MHVANVFQLACLQMSPPCHATWGALWWLHVQETACLNWTSFRAEVERNLTGMMVNKALFQVSEIWDFTQTSVLLCITIVVYELYAIDVWHWILQPSDSVPRTLALIWHIVKLAGEPALAYSCSAKREECLVLDSSSMTLINELCDIHCRQITSAP